MKKQDTISFQMSMATWNVTGKLFHSLHLQFEEQYSELAKAIDEIAERIRALGFRALNNYYRLSGKLFSHAIW